jgi:hypothetical protein
MARESGLIASSSYLMPYNHVLQGIKAFEALVRADERAAPVQEPVGEKEISAWAERHDIQGTPTDLRSMFEDAASFTTPPAAQPAQPAPANLWLYWKVDNKSVITGPFKTHSKVEAYGLDCIDQTPITVPAAQRTWVGLTEQEAAECWSTSTVRTWQAIEAKLKEKNAAAHPAPVQERPQNCGTGYCSCIECVMEPAPVQPIGYEKYAAIREGHRNASEEAYFAARPDLPLTTAMLKLFRDGFDRGYDTTPPSAQRQWVGLTLTERNQLCRDIAASTHQVRAIEAKLKEKNNGGPQPRESP